MPTKMEVPNAGDIVKRYVSGVSEKKLADENGFSRTVVRRLLREAGVTPRGRSEAEALKWQQMTARQRKRQVAAAHAATRGRIVSWEEKCLRAATCERIGAHIVPVETKLAKKLRQRGFDVTQQLAVGAYNLDVAVHEPPIAVEIFGGGWHSRGRHKTRHFERTKYLFDEGWAVIIIWVDGRRYPLGPGAYDYIDAFADFLCCHPAARRQYRVILGDGEIAPPCRSHLNSDSIIERLRAST